MNLLRRSLAALTVVALLTLSAGPAFAASTEAPVPAADQDDLPDDTSVEQTPAEEAPSQQPPAEDTAGDEPVPESGTRAASSLPAEENDDDDEEEETDPNVRALTDAQLRWGVNNESNNRAFAPGTFNFFRAGKLPDPGRGGQVIGEGQWTATDGDVSIEKWNGSAYRTATWAGRSTTPDGTTIPSATSGLFSEHQLVFDGGTGTVNTAEGTASISWTGDATILYYSGMSFFYISDPELEVVDGTATLTAELSGFATSMEDMTQWSPVAPRRVTIADFSDVDLSDPETFLETPRYAGVQVQASTPQVRSGEHWGSFPQPFVDFQQEAGAAAYWYSSGGSADRFKAALPVTVLYSAATSSGPPAPPPSTSPIFEPVSNPALAPPPPPASATAPTPVSLMGATPANRSVPLTTTAGTAPAASLAPAVYQPASEMSTMFGSDRAVQQFVWWALAIGLLSLALASLAGSTLYVRRLQPISQT